MRTGLIVCAAAASMLSLAAAPPGPPRQLQTPRPPASATKPLEQNLPATGAGATLIQHGHLYTVGPLGTINNGDVLIAGGKIV